VKFQEVIEGGIAVMLSTLPDIPDKKCTPIGVVYCVSDVTDGDLFQAFLQIQQQAINMRANAVVDIRINTLGGGYGIRIVVTGTAVQFI